MIEKFKNNRDMNNRKIYYNMKELSKKLDIPKMGRNNLIKFLREKKILDQYNSPTDEYRKFFKIGRSGIDPVLATSEGAELISKLLKG